MTGRDLIDCLADLPPGDYIGLRITGVAAKAPLAAFPSVPRTAELVSVDGTERILVFAAGPEHLAPGEEISLGPGLALIGIGRR
jgi:hypothetical protein